jgi:hypothetical protein
MCSNAAVLVARCKSISCTIGAKIRLERVVESVDEGLEGQGRWLDNRTWSKQEQGVMIYVVVLSADASCEIISKLQVNRSSMNRINNQTKRHVEVISTPYE